jgi:YidC/Oxa1 family membrane protein insertase
MDRRTVLAITLCFFIYLGWQKFYLEPRMPHGEQTSAQTQQTLQSSQSSGQTSVQNSGAALQSQGSSATNSSAPASDTAHHPSQTLQLATGTGEAIVGDSSQLFLDWKLKNYHQGLSNETPAIDLRSVTHQEAEMELAFDDASYAYLTGIQGQLHKNTDGSIEWTFEDANIKLSRTLVSNDQQNYVSTKLNAEFKNGKRPNYAFISLSLPYAPSDPEERDRSLIYFTDNSIERTSPKSVSLKQIITPVKYIGLTSRYFVMSVINDGPLAATGLIQPTNNNNRVSLVFPVTGNSISLPVKVYFGPKELDVLRGVDPTLDHTVDFGWFTIFAYPILKFLKFLYGFVGNYGVAIILLTVLLKLATYPLTYKSMKSMKEMAKLQPQLAKIREKYKDDKEALNRETLSMMKTHGYNPVAGCLPMLIQMPIFFALYRVLWSSIDLYHAPFFGYIHDLSAKDPYYVTPVVLSLTMFLQQKLTPNAAADPAQQKMMQFMPLMFGAMMISLPSGLTLYMLVNALASIGQQLILNKKFDKKGNAPVVLARAR